MSRGQGKVQRAVLDQLGADWVHEFDVGWLACAVYDLDGFDDPTPAQYEAVRSAVNRLVDEEFVVRWRDAGSWRTVRDAAATQVPAKATAARTRAHS